MDVCLFVCVCVCIFLTERLLFLYCEAERDPICGHSNDFSKAQLLLGADEDHHLSANMNTQMEKEIGPKWPISALLLGISFRIRV